MIDPTTAIAEMALVMDISGVWSSRDTRRITPTPMKEASVARCTRNRPAEDGVEVSLPYADYYLLEGILRVLDRRKLDHAIDLSSV